MALLNVGIVGFGLAGRVFHAPLVRACPRLRLTHIVQRHGDEAHAAYPDVTVARSLDALLQEQSVDLVVVATPNPSHLDVAARSLRAGKHVVVDKPFTNTSADADQLIALAQQHKRVLSVFHNRRWDADFLTVRDILAKGLLGRLVEFESRFDRFRPEVKGTWREQAGPGSGILYDLGSHLIDQVVTLFGCPRGIFANIQQQRDGAVADDNFELLLDYAQLKVTLKAGMLVREPAPRFVLYGTRGSFVKYELDPQEDALAKGESARRQGWGEEPEARWGILNTEIDGKAVRKKYPSQAGDYPAYYDNVARAIAGEGELAVKPEQARIVIRLIELAQESNQEKRVVACAF